MVERSLEVAATGRNINARDEEPFQHLLHCISYKGASQGRAALPLALSAGVVPATNTTLVFVIFPTVLTKVNN
jgi:hypothetical protein